MNVACGCQHALCASAGTQNLVVSQGGIGGAPAGTHAAAHGAAAHGVHVHPRTAPPDPARAQAVLDATLGAFAAARASDFAPSPRGKTHLKLTPQQENAFRAAFPGVPVPRSVMFDKATGQALAAVYVRKDRPVDLGLGPAHRHGPDRPYMQHVWFTPGRLELAFSDTTRRAEALRAVRNRA